MQRDEGLVPGREIGRGPHGRVCRAERPHGGAELAVKIFDDLDRAALARFADARRSLTALRSPHLVPVHDVLLDEHSASVVTDLVPGIDLDQHLRLVGPMAPGLAAELADQMLRGLWTVHDAGLVHGGVKPRNVLLDFHDSERPRAVLTDTGTAWLATDRSGSAAGDLEAVARLLATLLTGQESPDPVPEPARSLLLARARSAEEALAVLSGDATRPPAPPVRDRGPARRRLVVVPAVVVLAVMVLAGLAGFLVATRPGPGSAVGSATGPVAGPGDGSASATEGAVGGAGQPPGPGTAAGPPARVGAAGTAPGTNATFGRPAARAPGVATTPVATTAPGRPPGGPTAGPGPGPGPGPGTTAPPPPGPPTPGDGPITVTVPDVIGLKVGDAVVRLDVLGLPVLDSGALLDLPKGRKVTGQSPAAGASVPITQPVSLQTRHED